MDRHPNGLRGAPVQLSETTITKSRSAPRLRRKAAYIPDDPLLTAREAAAERGQALSTFWCDVRAGRVPPAYYVMPRCPRRRRSELRAVLAVCRAPAKGAGA
jgi:hypothetical protein